MTKGHDRLITAIRNGVEIDSAPVRGWRKVHFDMTDFFRPDMRTHDCGTAACIAGYASVLLGRTWKQIEESTADDMRADLGEVLGLDPERSTPDRHALLEMTTMLESGIPMAKVRAEHAINMLEIHRDTGKVDWKRAMNANYRRAGQ